MLKAEGAATLRTITKTRHVPEFLIEVMSPSDKLLRQREKCEEWIGAGVKEAVLLDPATKTACVYRPDRSVEEITEAVLVRSNILHGFVLDCRLVWANLTD